MIDCDSESVCRFGETDLCLDAINLIVQHYSYLVLHICLPLKKNGAEHKLEVILINKL